MRRHASKGYQNELDQRLIGVTQAERHRRRITALTSKFEKFPDYMKPAEMRELKALLKAALVEPT